MSPTQKSRMHVLDALRGIAAGAVVIEHFPALFFGWSADLLDTAVDFFFVLSGYVIASAYSARAEVRGNFSKLALIRIIRLYPMYLIGTLIGVLSLTLSWISRGEISDFHLAFWMAMPFAMLMLPSPGFGVTGNAFPLNSPSWSLLCELIVNLVYFQFGRYATSKLLIVLCSTAALLLFLNSDVLYGGYNLETFHIGVLRACYSFPMGILLYRLHSRLGENNRLHAPATVCFAALIVLLFLCTAPFRLPIILVAFPCLVFLAAGSGTPVRLEKIYSWLGRISYPIYAIHFPLLAIIVAVYERFGVTERLGTLTTTLLAIAILIVVCDLTERLADRTIQLKARQALAD